MRDQGRSTPSQSGMYAGFAPAYSGKQRPFGISLLVYVNIGVAVLGLLTAIAAFVMDDLSGDTFPFAPALILPAVPLLIYLSMGLWEMRRLARYLAIAAYSVLILLDLLSQLDMMADVFSFAWDIGFAVAILYLFKPSVHQAFEPYLF